jgi:hypothetical protein
MKTTLLIAIFSIILMMTGCVTTNQDIPPQDIVIGAQTPVGRFAIPLPKGSLNPEHEGDTWMKMKDYKKKLREYMQEKFGI